VVWFGEALDSRVLETAFSEARHADLCMVVGTSAVVHPAASVPLGTLRSGGKILEINPSETPLTDLAAVSIRASSGEVLPDIVPW
jgi:NAD-dependent deacetylase